MEKKFNKIFDVAVIGGPPKKGEARPQYLCFTI